MSLTPLVHLDQSLMDLDVGEVVSLPRDQRHHLTTVLRLRVGEPLELSDGAGGHATAELTEQGARLTRPPATVPRPQPRLRVVHALPKGRKLDEVIRNVVELGVDELEPVTASRSVRRPEGARVDKAVQRWQAVARSACEQARRLHAAHIAPVVGVEALEVSGRWLLAHPAAPDSLPRQLRRIDVAELARRDEAVTVAVGPEGGWTEQETDLLVSRGALPAHLGPTVLRTEHAAAAAVAVISAMLGRWS